MSISDSSMNRRLFLQQGAAGAGLFILAGATGSLKPAQAASVNRFPYDIERFSRTDPKFLSHEPVARFPSPLPLPRCLALGPDDRLYLAGRTGIALLGTDGSRKSTIETDTPVRCLALDRDATLYAGLKDHVRTYSADGRQLAKWAPPAEKTWITGLTIGTEALFAADSANRIIWRFSKDGKVSGKLGGKDKDREIPGLVVPSPYLDVKLASDGLLRVNNPGRHRVEVYTTDGDLELFWGKPSAAIQGFCGCCNPIALAVFENGRYITCEKGLPRVKIYAADGSFQSVVAGPEAFPKNARYGSARNPVDGTMGGLQATIAPDGRIFVLDLAAEEIQVFRPKA